MPKITNLNKAVFPVAGLGTRFLPATKAQPKEMLPVVDKPLIQYAVEEAYAAGIRHMIFVTGRNKRAIEDHFDTAYELENELEVAQKFELLKLVKSVQPQDMDFSYVRQPRSLGLGHAVLCAEHLVGNEPFAVLLADDLMVGEKPMFVVHKKPAETEGAFSATLFSGAKYTYDKPENWSELVDHFQAEFPKVKERLGDFEAPLIWTADFMLDTLPDGSDGYVLGEFNCSCVGFTSNLDEGIQEAIADEVISQLTARGPGVADTESVFPHGLVSED